MRLTIIQLPFRAQNSVCLKPAASLGWSYRPDWSQMSASAGLGTVESRRHASVKSQGAYKLGSKKTIMKKLGAKKTGDQYVIPGNIIYKQRGTIWHPGENTILGRNHSIHAAVAGYVKYYRDPAKHPKRQYIGVAWERDDKLPYPLHAVRKRKLGMVAVQIKPHERPEALTQSGIPRVVIRKEGFEEVQNTTTNAAADGEQSQAVPSQGKKETRAKYLARRWNERARIRRSNRVLVLHKDYSYTERNSAIGRLMGKHRGKTPGTVRYGSRHGVLRGRRRARELEFKRRGEELGQKRAMAEAERKIQQEKLAEAARKAELRRSRNAESAVQGGGRSVI